MASERKVKALIELLQVAKDLGVQQRASEQLPYDRTELDEQILDWWFEAANPLVANVLGLPEDHDDVAYVLNDSLVSHVGLTTRVADAICSIIKDGKR